MKNLIFSTTIFLLLSSCSSLPRSLLLGASSGLLLGSAIGYRHGGKAKKRTLEGGAVGLALGSLVAFLSYSDNRRNSSKKRFIVVPPKLPGPMKSPVKKSHPDLREKKVRTLWIPDKIDGDRFIEGHRIFILENPLWIKK